MSSVTRGISFHESLFYSLHRLVDAAVIVCTVRFAIQYTSEARLPELLTVSAASILTYHVVAELSGLYRSWRGTRLRREISCVLLTWAYTVPVLLGVGLFAQVNGRFSYTSKLTWILLTPAAILAVRILLRKSLQRLRLNGFNNRRFAICGLNELGVQLAHNVQRAPELGLRLAGFFDDRPQHRTTKLPTHVGQHLGDLEELVHRARRGDFDIIYITFPMRAEERIRNLLAKLGDTTASVYIVPDFFVFQLLHARWTNINGLPAVSVFENPLYGVNGLLKRTADLVFGSLLLAAVALPMLLIAALVKFSSRGPVFFRQRRYGLDGREILVWKFRTMTCCDDGSHVRQATRYDKRITRIGQLLRRTSLDELPQLFNVLGGSMSLVGPRPHASAHNEQYRSLIDGYMLRHKVKPGITGLAQVNGYRGETETLDKMQNRINCDHQYIREWSLWMDTKILFRTLAVVLTQRNAY
ncbi:MAG: undecaprenyl-phosphate glucose phosphotransferase [Pirellulales bacterium]|nr:undecaprenyl-phosphate glucose phosphotransferase [Pirellulales bacterium]